MLTTDNIYEYAYRLILQINVPCVRVGLVLTTAAVSRSNIKRAATDMTRRLQVLNWLLNMLSGCQRKYHCDNESLCTTSHNSGLQFSCRQPSWRLTVTQQHHWDARQPQRKLDVIQAASAAEEQCVGPLLLLAHQYQVVHTSSTMFEPKTQSQLW